LAALRKSKAKEALLDPVRARVNEIMADDSLTDEQRRQVIVDTILPVAMKISDDVYKEAESENNPYITQIASGARGNKGGFNSIKGADLLVADQNDNFMPVVLDRSYSEGFTPAQYFAASDGQRPGMLDVKRSRLSI
jgi:pantothenate kinase-related protein Tda10